MDTAASLWIRHEDSPTELRVPVVPADAARLVAAGHTVTVERSPQRVFPDAEYAAAGCRLAPAGSWPGAPAGTFVVAVKEPAAEPFALHHPHVFFGHAFKGQAGADRLLHRFAAGGGTLLDLEYLTDDAGRRAAAFGYWAGYVGAALAVLHDRGDLPAPLGATTQPALRERLARTAGPAPRVLVIGALGRCGTGARDALAAAGCATTGWDLAETRDLDRAALLAHDVLVNTVLSTEPGTPFLTPADVRSPARALRVVADVTCDITSDCNRLPIYDRTTSWAEPARRLHDAPPLDLVAIDNLPSLLPREASADFSAQLLPYLMRCGDAPAWRRCRDLFAAALDRRAVRLEESHD